MNAETRKDLRRRTLFAALGSFALAALPLTPAAAQSPLVVNGEQIADAALFDAAKREGTLIYYTVNFEEMERNTLERFKQDTGINFDVVRLAGGRMYERITTEFAGKQLKADLISLSEPILMQEFIDKGVLVPHRVPNWDILPAALKQKDGMYYTENRYAKLLGYNSQVLSEAQAPKSWADLLDPRFKDKLGIQEANSGGISWATVMFERKVVDPDYWRKLAANKPKLYNGMTPMAEDVVRGETAVGEMTFGLARDMMKAGAPLKVVFPKEGMPAAGILAGVASTAKHPNAAKLYLNWITSKHGGTIITEVFGDWASNPQVAPPDGSKWGLTLPPATALWMADTAESEKIKKQWVAEWDTIFRKSN